MTEIRADEMVTLDPVDPEVEVTVDLDEIDRVLDWRAQELHAQINESIVGLREAIVRSVRVRQKAPRSFKLTLDSRGLPQIAPKKAGQPKNGHG